MRTFRIFGGDITHTRAMTFPGNSSTLPLTTVTGTSIQSYNWTSVRNIRRRSARNMKLHWALCFHRGMIWATIRMCRTSWGDSNTGATMNNRDTVAAFGSPMSLGVGFSYVYDKRLTVGADFTFQKWSSVTYMNEKNAFCNRTKIALGAEFLQTLWEGATWHM